MFSRRSERRGQLVAMHCFAVVVPHVVASCTRKAHHDHFAERCAADISGSRCHHGPAAKPTPANGIAKHDRHDACVRSRARSQVERNITFSSGLVSCSTGASNNAVSAYAANMEGFALCDEEMPTMQLTGPLCGPHLDRHRLIVTALHCLNKCISIFSAWGDIALLVPKCASRSGISMAA